MLPCCAAVAVLPCIEELEKTITFSNKSVHPVLPHVNSLLHSAILACKASTTGTMEEFEYRTQQDDGPPVEVSKNFITTWKEEVWTNLQVNLHALLGYVTIAIIT